MTRLFRILACSLLLNGATILNAQDMIPFGSAQIVNSPDVRSWPVTTAITQVSIQGGMTSVIFTKQEGPNRWPDVTPPDWDGSLQYTLWLCLQTPQWTCSGFVQFWYGRPASGSAADPDVPSVYNQHWYYSARWAPLFGHGAIRPGETIGFLVTSGNARDSVGPFSVKERSNVVTFAATDTGVFNFSTEPAPPVVPPPPAPSVTPAPEPSPAPSPVAPVLPAELLGQLAQLNAQVNACNQGIATVNQNVTDGRKENQTFFQGVKSVWAQIGGPLLKYVVPAVVAFIGGKTL